jgi:protein SDA1
MAYVAESTHSLIPPDEISPLVKHIIDNFINDRCSEESMTIGINTVREMCAKNIHIIDAFNLNYVAGIIEVKK